MFVMAKEVDHFKVLGAGHGQSRPSVREAARAEERFRRPDLFHVRNASPFENLHHLRRQPHFFALKDDHGKITLGDVVIEIERPAAFGASMFGQARKVVAALHTAQAEVGDWKRMGVEVHSRIIRDEKRVARSPVFVRTDDRARGWSGIYVYLLRAGFVSHIAGGSQDVDPVLSLRHLMRVVLPGPNRSTRSLEKSSSWTRKSWRILAFCGSTALIASIMGARVGSRERFTPSRPPLPP